MCCLLQNTCIFVIYYSTNIQNMKMQNYTLLTVKRSPRVHKDGFEQAFYNLPHHELNAVKDALMDSLGWSIASFYYKKRGVAPIRENEIPVIESIFSGFGINAWTGNKI